MSAFLFEFQNMSKASEWVLNNCRFATVSTAHNLDLASLAKEVAQVMKGNGFTDIDFNEMLRVLRMQGYEYQAISKREKELNLSFPALVSNELRII
jgi:NDP-sugar pyrophosphorylase family protein